MSDLLTSDPLRAILVDELVMDEGIRLKPYVDTVGHLTIGIGRDLTGKGISRKEAYDLLQADITESVADLAGSFLWFLTLSGPRQRAVVNLRFNLGPERFRKFRKFLAAMAREDYPTAGAELLESHWYHQVQPRRSSRVLRQVLGEDDL